MTDDCQILEQGNYSHCYTHDQTFRWRSGEKCPRVVKPPYRRDEEFIDELAALLGVKKYEQGWRERIVETVAMLVPGKNPTEPYGAVDMAEGCMACATTMRRYCPNCDTLHQRPVMPDPRQTPTIRHTVTDQPLGGDDA